MALISSLRGVAPRIDPSSRLAETAVIEGDVTLGPGTCILHGAVLSAQGAPSLWGGTALSWNRPYRVPVSIRADSAITSSLPPCTCLRSGHC